MNLKYNICALTLLVCLSTFVAAEDAKVSDNSPSPVADMVIIPSTQKSSTMKESNMEMAMEMKQIDNADATVTTVGDFIIHPLVAFRPRPAVTSAESDVPEGKQAEATATTTAAPWPVFGLGYGQAIGSSLSNVAGQITGWLTDRIQMPALESPVRDSTTTTTSTTTPRPDVIVRVQHRPSISVNDKRKRPTLNENDFPEDEYEQDENEVEEEEDEDVDEVDYDEEDEEEEIEDIRPQRRPVRKQQRRPQQNRKQQVRRPTNSNRQQFNRFDDYAGDDSDDEYYYAPQFSSKRSQSNFLNLGQQNLLNQIRLLTRGQTPGEVVETMHKTNPDRQHGTFLVRRNGQTVYLAPEFLSESEQSPFHFVAGEQAQQFPQPPLSKPLKVNGQIAQYITIPYNQLGISPPQGASAIAEGIQSQPLILSIPQSALKQLQSKENPNSPVITPNAVPLLAEASLGDIFKPPQIPPSRTQPSFAQHTSPLTATYTPLVVLTPNGGTKIRPGTIVEKSPALNIKQVKTEEAYIIVNDDNEEEARNAKDGTKFYQLPKGSRFGVRQGREIDQSQSPAKEELIPVKIVSETEPADDVQKIIAPVMEKELMFEPVLDSSVETKQLIEPMMDSTVMKEEVLDSIMSPAIEKNEEISEPLIVPAEEISSASEAQIEPKPAPETIKIAETQA